MQRLIHAIMDALLAKTPYKQFCLRFQVEYDMTEEDVDYAWDRVQGGIVRALTGNPENEPEQEQDPIAWLTFQAVWRTLPPNPDRLGGKVATGPWEDWWKEELARMKAKNSKTTTS